MPALAENKKGMEHFGDFLTVHSGP